MFFMFLFFDLITASAHIKMYLQLSAIINLNLNKVQIAWRSNLNFVNRILFIDLANFQWKFLYLFKEVSTYAIVKIKKHFIMTTFKSQAHFFIFIRSLNSFILFWRYIVFRTFLLDLKRSLISWNKNIIIYKVMREVTMWW